MLKKEDKWVGLAETAEECWVEKPEGKKYWTDFLLIYHEHLFVFRKPGRDEEIKGYELSTKWW